MTSKTVRVQLLVTLLHEDTGQEEVFTAFDDKRPEGFGKDFSFTWIRDLQPNWDPGKADNNGFIQRGPATKTMVVTDYSNDGHVFGRKEEEQAKVDGELKRREIEGNS